jgi:membrane fusion protein (multidrug efflux system)
VKLLLARDASSGGPTVVRPNSRVANAILNLLVGSALFAIQPVAAQSVPVRTAKVEAVRVTDPLVFDGRVAAMQHAEVSNRINGVVSAIHFTLGQNVKQGDLLFELAAESYEAAVRAAHAHLDRAEAQLQQKEFVLGQQVELQKKGVASELRYHEAANEAAIARADAAAARAALKSAELELARTKVTAPISGRIGAPLVALGSFLEAESGKPLAKIVQLDPIRVVYKVPYEQRLTTRAQTGTASVEALLERVMVELRLPGGELYPARAHPEFSSTDIDPATGTLEVSATFPNPDQVLLPGLAVQVTSYVEGAQQVVAAIPREAARTDQAGLHVLVVPTSGLVERRPVSLLRAHDGRLLVAGVFKGEVVVSDPEFRAAPGAMVAPHAAGRQ